MGRPRLHADDAARRAAYLEGKDRFDLVLPERIGATVRDIAAQYGASNAEVLADLVRFALTNRNWKTEGLLWSMNKGAQ